MTATIFKSGDLLLLNASSYRIIEYAGRGAIADTYLAAINTTSNDVVLRVLRSGVALDSSSAEGMRNEARVLEVFNRAEDAAWPQRAAGPLARLERSRHTVRERGIICALDSGQLDDGRPFVIQELAPPAFRPLAISTRDDELRTLSVALALAHVMETCHGCGYTLKDFDPIGEKIDRVRVEWADEGLYALKVIDWNVTGGPNATLEECARDLLMFGGHLYHFLVRQHLPAGTLQLPIDPGVGVTRWRRISEGSRSITRRLLHPQASLRYPNAREVRQDLEWWIRALQCDSAATVEHLLWQPADFATRRLALAELALTFAPEGELESRFLERAAQARRELDQLEQPMLDQGIINLRTGLYRKALEAFAPIAHDLHIRPRTARGARIYHELARLGLHLRDYEAHPLAAVAFGQTRQATELLLREQWRAADEQLEQLPELFAQAPGVGTLRNLAKAWLLAEQSSIEMEAAALHAPRLEDLAAWPVEQTSAIEQIRRAELSLRDAAETLAPDDPELRALAQAATLRRVRTQEVLACYNRIARWYHEARTLEAEVAASRRSPAIESAIKQVEQALLELDTQAPDEEGVAQLRGQLADYADDLLNAAQQAQQQIEQRRQASKVIAEIVGLLNAGDYDHALQQIDRLTVQFPALSEVQVYSTLAEQLRERLQQVHELADEARNLISAGAWAHARSRLRTLFAEAEPPIRLATRAQFTFVLPAAVQAHELLAAVDQLEAHDSPLPHMLHDDQLVEWVRELDQIERTVATLGISLAPRHQEARATAQLWLRVYQQAEAANAMLHQPPYEPSQFRHVAQAIEHLQPLPTARAHELCTKLINRWQQAIRDEPSLPTVELALTIAQAMQGELRQAIEREAEGVAHVHAANELLRPGSDSGLPMWLTMPDPARALAELGAHTADICRAEPLLISLHGQSAKMTVLLQDQLGQALDDLYTHAVERYATRDFETTRVALTKAQRLLEHAPPAFVQLERRERLSRITALFEQRMRQYATLEALVADLAESHLSFDQARRTLPLDTLDEPLLRNFAVPATSAIRRLATVERELRGGETPAGLSIAQLVDLQDEIHDIGVLMAHETLFSPLITLIDRTCRQVDTSIVQAISRLCARVSRYGVLPGPAPEHYAHDVWQLRSLPTAATTHASAALVQTTLDRVAPALRQGTLQMWYASTDARNYQQWQLAIDTITQTITLNAALASPDATIIDSDRQLAAPFILSESLLQQWLGAAQQLGTLVEPAPSPAADWTGRIRTITVIEQHLYTLHTQVAFDIVPIDHNTRSRWRVTTRTARALVRLATTLQAIEADKGGGAMEHLNRLDRATNEAQLAAGDSAAGMWALLPSIRAVQDERERIWKVLEQSLHKELSRTLALPHDDAMLALERQFLRYAETEAVAVACARQIEASVRRLARRLSSPQAATHAWGVIAHATQPWASTPVEPQSPLHGVWANLHKSARRERQRLRQRRISRRRVVIAIMALVIIILLLVLLMFIAPKWLTI